MANYNKYENLPAEDRLAYDYGKPIELLDIFKCMIEARRRDQWGSTSTAMIWNALCARQNFPDEETYKATVLPIALHLVNAATVHQSYVVCSPSFQKRLAGIIRTFYPDVKGHAIK